MHNLKAFYTSIFAKYCELDVEKIERQCYEHQKTNPSLNSSGVGSYQGHDFFCEELHNEIIESIPQNKDKPIKGASVYYWMNINPSGSYNGRHTHGAFFGNFMSGIFYVKTPKESGRLDFWDPRYTITESADNHYYNNATKSLTIDPEPNLLLFFPPWLEHSVELNQSEEDRISISFNISIDY
jgi:hypothetical protein